MLTLYQKSLKALPFFFINSMSYWGIIEGPSSVMSNKRLSKYSNPIISGLYGGFIFFSISILISNDAKNGCFKISYTPLTEPSRFFLFFVKSLLIKS